MIGQTRSTVLQDIAVDKLEWHGLSNTARMPGKDVEVDIVLAIEGNV